MRAGRTAAIALVAALLGGGAALVAAKAVGLLGHGARTVVVQEPAPVGDARPIVVAKPLAGNGFEPAQIFARRSGGVVTILSYFDTSGTHAGQGSGFVVSADGEILTNAHVVTTAGQAGVTRRARTVYVQFADGDRVPARIVGYDLFDDVAVVRVDPHDHAVRPVPLGHSASVVVGQPVAAIGSPFGNTDSLTVGVVSAVRRSIPSLTTSYDLVDAIQTDAPINHGNSGGPLFDARGQVIGINAQIRSAATGSGFDGVGFAVPIDSARRSLDEIQRTGAVHYAYVGIETDDLTPSLARHFGYAAKRGALVVRVVPHTGAAVSGLRAGDRLASFRGLGVKIGGDAIVAIDGIPVRSAEDVVRIVASRLVPGEHARFTVVRGGARRTVSVELGERPPAG